jgi:hypothetical protein
MGKCARCVSSGLPAQALKPYPENKNDADRHPQAYGYQPSQSRIVIGDFPPQLLIFTHISIAALSPLD